MSFAGEATGTYLSGGFGSTDQEDIDRGTRILNQYHNYMKMRYSDYKLNFVDLVNYYASQRGGKGFLLSLGAAANIGGIDGPVSDSQANSAMDTLAIRGGGRIPDSWNAYISVLSDTVSDPYSFINFVDAVLYAAEELPGQITEGAREVGDSLLEVGGAALDLAKIAKPLMWTMVVLFAWSVYRNRDQVGDSLLKGAKGAAGMATGGLYNLGSAATARAVKSIRGNPAFSNKPAKTRRRHHELSAAQKRKICDRAKKKMKALGCS